MVVRAPADADATAIVELRSRFAPEPFSEERLRREWSEPGFDRDRDARITDGGYAAVEMDDEGRNWIELHGDQLEPLVDWALDRATGARVFSGAWEGDEAVKRALETRDFAVTRHSYRMAIELHDPSAGVEPGSGIELRAFRPDDARAVYEAHMEAFEDSWEHVREPYERWSHWTLERPGFDPDVWLLALAADQLAGIVLCRVDDGDPATGWISILGVRRRWRRRGLGEALLRAGFAALARKGCRRAVLGVDADSLTGARRLYERAGMHVTSRFDIYERSA